MEPQPRKHDPFLEAAWHVRQQYWRRKLGRLRLAAEPLEEQLDRYRRVTWMLTAVPTVLGLMFVSLFAAFGRPDIGLLVALILFFPVVSLAWLDYAVLNRRARRYTHELREYQKRQPDAGSG